MQRRGFLGAILAACAAPAIVSAKSLMPGRSLLLPTPAWSAADWTVGEGNTLLTISQITNEALRVLNGNLTFMANVNREWAAAPGSLVHIRRPQRFARV